MNLVTSMSAFPILCQLPAAWSTVAGQVHRWISRPVKSTTRQLIWLILSLLTMNFELMHHTSIAEESG